MTKMQLIRDVNGNITYGLPFSDYKVSALLATSVEQNMVVEDTTSKWLAIFAYTGGEDVWVALNATAEVPAGAFAATTSEKNPIARYVKAGDTISMITNGDAVEVGITFYAV